jgi:LacI family transcriptional regulator
MSQKKLSMSGSPSRTIITDVAAALGISIATVSRALNDRPQVADKTRERVLAYAQEMGYVSNRHARALVSGQPAYVGFAVPQVRSQYFMRILEGAAHAADDFGAHLVVCPTDYRSDREVSLLDRLLSGGAAGALLVLPAESTSELARLRQRQYPFVVIDPTVPLEASIPVVSVANISGGKAVTEHLIACGHRRIGIITGPRHWCASVDRLAGYHAALAAAGILFDPQLVGESTFESDGGFTIAGGRAATHALLDLAAPPTAIFALNDEIALGVIRAVHERGLKVPDDISVVGFDNADFASLVTPTLTTVNQPAQDLGRIGVSMLFSILGGKTLDATRVELSTRLIVRNSTSLARKEAPPN